MTPEESFLKTYEGTLKLHRLDREGKLDSQEADDIRDDLDPHWYNMTEDQQDNIRNISERISRITYQINQKNT